MKRLSQQRFEIGFFSGHMWVHSQRIICQYKIVTASKADRNDSEIFFLQIAQFMFIYAKHM